MSKKFGFTSDDSHNFTPEEEEVVNEFFKIMKTTGCDFTNTFRDLCDINQVDDAELATRIMAHMAPKELLLKNLKPAYADNPQV
jgi:uncharacterized protein YdiU (UPF0061 family)